MSQPPVEGQLCLWRGKNGGLKEVDVFIPQEDSPRPILERRINPIRQQSSHMNLSLGLDFE